MAKRIRGFETVGDMLRSLAVVGAFVAVILLITIRETPDRIQAVDPTETFLAVSQAAPFAADLPGRTPAGWTSTSARSTLPDERPYSWYVGYSTDTEAFVAVTQVFGDADETAEALRAVDATGEEVGSVRIDDVVWTKLERADGSRRALVRNPDPTPEDGAAERATTVVLGSAPWEVLESTAAALRPASSERTTVPKPSPTKTIRR